MDDQRLPAAALLKSFLVVAGGAFFLFMAFGVTIWLVARFFFPEAWSILAGEPMSLETLLTDSRALPIGLLAVTIGVMAVLCAVTGWWVVRLVPFAPEAHAFFLAVVLFVTQLQNLLGEGGQRHPALLVMLVVFPGAVVAGAKWGLKHAESRNSSGSLSDSP